MNEGNDKLLTVAQVHELTGITAAQLKNWDKEGVLVAQRTGEGVANNRKLYTMDDVQRAREILLYRKLGFSLYRIKEIIAAPESERASLVAARTSELREDYAHIKKQIELSSALEVADLDSLMDALVGAEGPEMLIDAYERDRNLNQLIRWSRSHTDRDNERANAEIREALEGLAQMPDGATWEQVKAQIARFCDAWSRPFGWPTVRQMLIFHSIFSEMTEDGGQVDIPFDAKTCESIADAFLLGWASSMLKVMEDILAILYLNACEGVSIEQVRETAEVLQAMAAEYSHQPHAPNDELSSGHAAEFIRVIESLFQLLEDVALDEGLERYLHLDELYAVDGPGLETARHIVIAHVEGCLETWFSDGGAMEIEQRIGAWLDALESHWEAMTCDDADGVWADCCERHGADEELGQFVTWIKEHYACVLADPPEARWASEEEDCAVEKKTREYVEQMELEEEEASSS